MTKAEIEEIIRMIYQGFYTPDNLPIPLYNFIASKLEKGVYQGFGGGLGKFSLNSPNWTLVSDLRYNVYEFSAAKTFQEVLDAQSLIFDDDGFLRPFKDYNELTQKVFDKYDDYLETEYNTAIQQSMAARDWSDFEEAGIKKLMYQTQNDANVRDEHAALDGLVYPIGDPFWNVYAPKNGWNCRCYLVEADDEITSPKTTKAERKEYNKGVPPLFRVNPGKDRMIYDKEKHPYFDVPPQYENNKANNFNLPLPE
jgi:SPP1 gp7 family putative phage head morphogenesis protein